MKRVLSAAVAGLVALSSLISAPAFAENREAEALPTLTVDLTDEQHDIIHGAAGFLYGISSEGVPDVNTITPLKPKVLATKGALGTEHPYGDALDVAEEFFEAGGEQVQMYCSNYYGVFGVTADAYEYGNVLETIIAPTVLEWKNSKREKYPDIDSRIVYIPINEGTPRNYNGGVERTIMNSWKVYYEAIRKADPNAVIAGPNNSAYGDSYGNMRDFLTFCRDNNCLPDIVTWHELQVSCLGTMNAHIADYRQICRDLGIEEKQVVINEYADYADCGVPGRLVNWIARLEDNQVYGCLPFWHQANNLNDLAAGANQGNGAWWVYKWYGDMSGKTLSVIQQNTSIEGFYGVASIDANKRIANVICGGADGNARVRLENVNKTACFSNAKRVHIKVEASYFSGYHGAAYGTETVSEGTYALDEDGGVTVELNDVLFSTAYNITVTEAGEDDEVKAPSVGSFRAEYEAENAKIFGEAAYEPQNAYPPYYYSGNARVNNFNSPADGIEYTIYVPFDGRYKLEFIYGNGVGESRNDASRHNPQNLNQLISVDGGSNEILHLPNTLFYAMEGKVDKYYDLTAGSHKIRITGDGILSGGAQDVLYISYNGAYGMGAPVYNEKFEAEAADFNSLGETTETTVHTSTELAGYSGNGYVSGLDQNSVENGGGIRWIVNVEESGLYDIEFRYAAQEDGSIRVYLDNTNLTFDNYAASAATEAVENWADTGVTLFLRQGINIIDIDSDGAAVDYMRVVRSELSPSVTIEAEDSRGNFETAVSSSGETYVKEMKGAENPGEYLEFTVNVPAEGKYKMQVFQSNNDICGSHYYNIKIIDRYASFEVNGGNAERYFFPNSFSDDTFLERTIPLGLKAGENTIRVYNDDSWHVLWGGTTSTPGTNELENFTPNFDKFIITPASTQWEKKNRGNKITSSSTKNGYIYCDKNFAADGETVTVYLRPDGAVKRLTLNGEDITALLATTDNTIYTAEFTANGDAELYAEFTPAIEGNFDDPGYTLPESILDGGKRYRIIGENLFTNGDFTDNSGAGMEQWYVGVNKNGHPTGGSGYQIPRISSDGSAENLVPLAESGLLTTGAYEKDAPDTFYYGADNSRKYLVEHMSSDWQTCAWNGAHSLLGFVPVKPNTKYYFHFSAYTLSGAASVRCGTVNMEDYAPEDYATNASLNFTDCGLDCTNGDVQNVGGAWKDYSMVLNSGSGNYFLFNAYWLQMAEYLCLGDFRLYELSSDPMTEITEIEAPAAISVKEGGELKLPEYAAARTEDGSELKLPIEWLNADGADTAKAGAYSVTGAVTIPQDCYYDGSLYIKQRVVVRPAFAAEIAADTSENGIKITVTANETFSGILYASVKDAQGLMQVNSRPVELKAGETLYYELAVKSSAELMLWTKELMPLAEKVTVNKDCTEA